MDTFSADISKDVETKFDTLNYGLDRPLPRGKNKKKVIGLMKYELGGKIKAMYVGLRPKMYGCLTEDNCCDKKTKLQKSVIKWEIKFKDYKNCQEANWLKNKINYLEKSNVDVSKLKKSRKIIKIHYISTKITVKV